MICPICNLTFTNKRPQAIYCSRTCKCKANKNLESISKYNTSTAGRAKAMWHNAKTRAKENNYSFDLTEEWIENKLINGFCEVTNLPFVITYLTGKQPWAPSLDKIDPLKGYTMDNTRVVVWLYNAAKNVFSDNDVLLMANALVKNKDGSLKSQTSKKERK